MNSKYKLDVYEKLWADYIKNVSEDTPDKMALYRYFATDCSDSISAETYYELKVRDTRRNMYLYVLSCKKAYEEKKITSYEVKDLLKNIYDNKRKELYKSVAISKIKALLAGDETLDLADILEDTAKVLMITRIKQFIADCGISLQDGNFNGKPRRSDDILDIYGMLVADGNDDVSVEDSNNATMPSLDDENYLAECRALYNAINSSGGDFVRTVFVPVYIDVATGAGIFIIGVDKLGAKIKKNCCYSVITLNSVDHSFIRDKEEGMVLKSNYSKHGTFDNLDDTIDFFKTFITKAKEDVYYGYKTINEDLPIGTPKRFVDFFETEGKKVLFKMNERGAVVKEIIKEYSGS